MTSVILHHYFQERPGIIIFHSIWRSRAKAHPYRNLFCGAGALGVGIYIIATDLYSNKKNLLCNSGRHRGRWIIASILLLGARHFFGSYFGLWRYMWDFVGLVCIPRSWSKIYWWVKESNMHADFVVNKKKHIAFVR